MSEVQKQFEYFLANQDELVEQYNGRYVVIVGEAVVGDFESEVGAYGYATGKFEPGQFIIQLVTPGTEHYTQTFHSRVAI